MRVGIGIAIARCAQVSCAAVWVVKGRGSGVSGVRGWLLGPAIGGSVETEVGRGRRDGGGRGWGGAGRCGGAGAGQGGEDGLNGAAVLHGGEDTQGTSADGHALPGCRLRRADQNIQQNLDLTLAELAAVVCMSRYQLARLFWRAS